MLQINKKTNNRRFISGLSLKIVFIQDPNIELICLGGGRQIGSKGGTNLFFRDNLKEQRQIACGILY